MKKLLFLFALIPLLGNSQKIRKEDLMAYNWPYFRLNGERLSHKEAKIEFLKVPGAHPHYKKHRSQVYIALASLISSAIVVTIASNDRYETGKSNTGLYITAAGLSVTSLITILGSINNRKKAVKTYNDHVP